MNYKPDWFSRAISIAAIVVSLIVIAMQVWR